MASDKDNTNSLMMEEFRLGMNDFKAAMDKREDFALRIAKRTTRIIRFSMLGLVVLGIIMFFLIWTLTSNMTDHMAKMSEDIKAMRSDFHSVATNVSLISDDFTAVRGDMSVLSSTVV